MKFAGRREHLSGSINTSGQRELTYLFGDFLISLKELIYFLYHLGMEFKNLAKMIFSFTQMRFKLLCRVFYQKLISRRLLQFDASQFLFLFLFLLLINKIIFLLCIKKGGQ